MINFFLKHFIRNYEDIDNPSVRKEYGKLAGIVGVVSNLILCCGKIIVGSMAGSLSIIADGINNLADASSSVITIIGFKLAGKPEDREHPYGHERIEYIAGIIVSIMIVAVGISLGKAALEKILNPVDIKFSLLTAVVLCIAIFLKIWQAYFYFYLGKQISSGTLRAGGTDSRNDAISTFVVLLSMIIYKYGEYNLDGWLGLFVALFIIWSGVSLIKETSSPLLGEAPDECIVREIVALIKAHKEVLGIHDLILHNYGKGKIFGTIHVEVDAKEDILKSHEIVDFIEKEVRDVLNINFVTHMDPVVINDPEIKRVRKPLEKLVLETEGISNLHDLRAVVGENRVNIIFDLQRGTECPFSEEEIIRKAEGVLKEIDRKFYAVITFDRNYSAI